MLAYAWATYPYSLFVLNSNANDSLVAMLLVYSFLALKSSRLRGATLALAGSREVRAARARPAVRRLLDGGCKTLMRFSAAFALVTLIVMLPVLLDGGLERFYDRTVGFQLGRESPFSIWGQEEGLARRSGPRQGIGNRRSPCWWPSSRAGRPQLQVAALGAAVLIALELSLTHWFYLYIVWFLPFVLIALFGATRSSNVPRSRGAPPGIYRTGSHDELDRAREPVRRLTRSGSPSPRGPRRRSRT